MNENVVIKPLQIFVIDEGNETELIAGEHDPKDFFRNDLKRYRFSGTIPHGPDYSVVNFLDCVFHETVAKDVDFSECDFKDTFFQSAVFINCKFNGGTFATTFFSDTQFQNCKFYNLGAQNCDFYQVHFADCNLTNLLIKSSRFSECTFTNCISSNKICEMSTLFDVTFFQTPIQVETITSNFGLTYKNLDESFIRSGRQRESHSFLDQNDLQEFTKSTNLSSLERLSLDYFLKGTLVDGSIFLDEALDITRWTRIYKNPGSFVEQLDKFGEFLIYLYEEERLLAHSVLLLHHITSTLTNSVAFDARLHRIGMSLGGLHLLLSRIVEEFLYTLDLISSHTSNSLDFLVEGPENDRSYFQNLLKSWVDDDAVAITKLERNSPLQLELVAQDAVMFIPLLAAFLATRTKLEITRLKKDFQGAGKGENKKIKGRKELPGKKAPQTSQSLQTRDKTALFSFSSGFVKAPNPGYEFRVRSLMPGSLLVDLKLNFSTTFAARLRNVLLYLLTGRLNKQN